MLYSKVYMHRWSLALFTSILITSPLAAATRTWTGAISALWSNALNWGGIAPVAGDDLVFPLVALNQTNTNDLAAGTSFKSISFGNSYTIGGNSLSVGAGGIVATGGVSTLSTPIVLTGTALILDVSGGAQVILSGVISGSGGILKSGSNEAFLAGTNTYNGTTTINGGFLILQNTSALGIADGTAANGTVVNDGGTLQFQNIAIGNENLTLNGLGQSGNGALQATGPANSLSGPVTLGIGVKLSVFSASATMSFLGPISGSGQFIMGTEGVYVLANSGNSFTGGASWATGFPGTLRLGASNAFPAATAVSVPGGGVFDLNSFSNTISSLSGGGKVTLGSGTLTITGSSVTTFSGILSGTGNVTLTGAQTLTLTGNNTMNGSLTDSGSTLVISGGTMPGTLVVNNAASSVGLSNNATIGPVNMTAGQITPGSGGTGMANTGSLSFGAGSTYHVLLSGASSQLNVTGTVSLGGSTLSITPSGSFGAGTVFTIINNDGADAVVGTFAGLPEGATASGGGRTFTISYAGGTGNDITLTALTGTGTTLTGDANGDGVVNVGDIFYLINFLFAGGPAPVNSSDVNGDGSTNVSDVFYLINFLFAGGPAPH